MSYSRYSETKIPKILRFLKKDLSQHTPEQLKVLLEQKYRVGVHIHYGRLQGHVHTFEVWRKMRDNWLEMLFYVEIAVERFKPEVD